MKKTGFYIIKDSFFTYVDDPYLKGNKEGNRPHYYCFQDMFPITEEFIEREYTIAGNHLMLTSEHSVKEVETKARKIMGLLKRGVRFIPTQPDINEIIKKLKQK